MNKCLRLTNIYNDDLISIKKNDPRAILFYKNDDKITIHFNLYQYKLKLVNDQLVLTIKPYTRKIEEGTLLDVDLLSKYRRLKSRGCESVIKNYAKLNTLKILKNMVINYNS